MLLLRQWPAADDDVFAAVVQSANGLAAPGSGLTQGFRKGPMPQYDSGDGEHLNAEGDAIFASRIQIAVEKVLAQQGFKSGS